MTNFKLEIKHLLIIALVIHFSFLKAEIINVPQDYSSIQAAIEAANNGDTIIVANGTYTGPENRNITFSGKEINLFSENGPENCIIDCLNEGKGFIFQSGDNDNTSINGFTIKNGFASAYETKGGAMAITSCDPTIENCIFSDSHCIGEGGGIILISSNAVLKNCIIQGNTGGGLGAGIYIEGGSPSITNCAFYSNNTHAKGGGIYNNSSQLTLLNCIFSGNIAGSETGGGVNNGGGGVYNDDCSPTIVNCLFSGNKVFANYGGGVRNYGSSSPTLINCTFSKNSAQKRENAGGGIHNGNGSPILKNCIFWGNYNKNGMDETAQIYGNSGNVTFSCIQGLNEIVGEGNIGEAPDFFDLDGQDNHIGTEDDNLRLLSTSPAINAGNNNAIPITVFTDLDDDERVINETVDMGAYESPKQGFLLSVDSLIVPEGGSADFSISLAEDPLSAINVEIIKASGDEDLSIESAGMLSFNSTNYSIPQIVTLSADEDWDSYSGFADIYVSAQGIISDGVVAVEGENELFPTVFYINGATGNDDNNGLTQETAFATIQKGVDISTDGDIVEVADGTYDNSAPGNDEVLNFNGKEIIVKSENGPTNCILQSGAYVVYFNSGETHNSVLSGFTIRYADPGAGIECHYSSPTIQNNIFCYNWSEYGLGAVFFKESSAILINNLFYENKVYGSCAGVVCIENSHIYVVNNTFIGGELNLYNNPIVGVHCDESSNASIVNSIFWGTGNLGFYNCNVSYSCFDKDIPGTGNISIYPEFADTLNYDFSLDETSECINSGNNNILILDSVLTDINGNMRIYEGIVDIGAYEYQFPINVPEIIENEIDIYPNPVNDQLYIELSNSISSFVYIDLYDLEGKLMTSKTCSFNDVITLDVSAMSKGIYCIQIITDKKIIRKKICVK